MVNNFIRRRIWISSSVYIFKVEFLNEIFGLISAPIDEVKYLKEDWWKSAVKTIFGSPISNVADSFDKHSIDTVIELLEEK